MNNISITDKDYLLWVKDLASRYRRSQIKAAVRVNTEQLKYYWLLGRDIVRRKADARWGSKFFKNLSEDLKKELPGATCFSVSNILYMKNFYLLFQDYTPNAPQVVEQLPATETSTTPQVVEQSADVDIFAVPWGHYRYIIDRFMHDKARALFYVRKTVEYGWSRAMLLNFLDTDLYEREGKAVTNFAHTLPEPMSDLARELTKDPYNFAFAGITGRYNETLLKKALLTNITDFLLELGTGFAYVGKEYRLEIGGTENFIDLLFYHLNLRCYVVIEVKVDKFSPGDVGQLGTYVVACNHLMKRPDDNPTIGLLVCKSKDNTLAQYALEGSNQPIGISAYELEKLYPAKVEGLIPTIEELEAQLNKTEEV